MKRIAFIKTGWCDTYDGDTILGKNYRYVREHGYGHEIYNMRPYKNKFYIYVPPTGGSAAPVPESNHRDWVIILVSRKNGTGKIVVVGWYTGAQFVGKYLSRPPKKAGISDPRGNDYFYTIVADHAYLIPSEMRDKELPIKTMRSSPVYYARGEPKHKPDTSREKMAKFAERLLGYGSKINPIASKVSVKDSRSGGGYASKEHRDKVEKASMAYVKKYYREKSKIDKYKIKDVSWNKGIGYDLVVRNKKVVLNIEVKGTSGHIEQFFITKSEDAASISEHWHLAVVTNALTKPTLKLYSGKEYKIKFKKIASQFQCTRKS